MTNTDRLDRALGFAPVTYQTRFEPGRGVRTFAEGPQGRHARSRRRISLTNGSSPGGWGFSGKYTQGPFKWLVSSVELLPRPGGGTTLVHSLRLSPAPGQFDSGSRWGVGVGMRKSLEKVYRRIDATLKGQRERGLSPALDPFEERARMPAARRQAAGPV